MVIAKFQSRHISKLRLIVIWGWHIYWADLSQVPVVLLRLEAEAASLEVHALKVGTGGCSLDRQ